MVVGAGLGVPPDDPCVVDGCSGCVVGVMVGGGTDSSEVFGGGVAGVVSWLPKIETSICWAEG